MSRREIVVTVTIATVNDLLPGDRIVSNEGEAGLVIERTVPATYPPGTMGYVTAQVGDEVIAAAELGVWVIFGSDETAREGLVLVMNGVIVAPEHVVYFTPTAHNSSALIALREIRSIADQADLAEGDYRRLVHTSQIREALDLVMTS